MIQLDDAKRPSCSFKFICLFVFISTFSHFLLNATGFVAYTLVIVMIRVAKVMEKSWNFWNLEFSEISGKVMEFLI